jgi:SAM-dependent methyltransferase
VLDIGTGTGTIARGFALEGCYVTAVDPSYALLEKAELLDKNEGVKVNYVVGTAENTGMPNNYFDVVVAGQAWHWFKHEEAIKEVNRVIKYNGKLVIAHFDWLPLKNSIPKLSEELIRKHNPYWRMHGGTGFYPQWTIQLAEACFEGIETYTFDQEVYYTHEDWRGRIRASAGISAALSQDKVDIFDKEHAEKLKQSFPQEVLRVPHRCFTLFATPPKLKLVQDKPEEREVKPNLKL